MSVGKICDEGHTVTFSDILAVGHNKQGEETCKFHRTSGVFTWPSFGYALRPVLVGRSKQQAASAATL